jgi:tetrahydromethanopterin S-methyltransferase subunit E
VAAYKVHTTKTALDEKKRPGLLNGQRRCLANILVSGRPVETLSTTDLRNHVSALASNIERLINLSVAVMIGAMAAAAVHAAAASASRDNRTGSSLRILGA